MKKHTIFSYVAILAFSSLGTAFAQESDCQENITSPERVVYGLNGNLFIPSQDFNSEIPYAKYLPSFIEAANLLKVKGIDLVIVPVSHKGLTEVNQLNLDDPIQKSYKWQKSRKDYETFISGLIANKINVIDVLKIAEQTNGQFINKTDWHWKPQSAKMVAEATASIVKKIPSYSQIPVREFSTTDYMVSLVDGAAYYADQLKKRCGFENKNVETVEASKTQMQSKLDLLSDDTPQIILVGTSFSASPWNFSGYLEQSLQREISNYAVVGGGVHSGIQSYLLGDEFEKNKPKVIIWEFDVDRLYDSVLEQHHWQQLLDLLKSNCDNMQPSFVGKIENRITDLKFKTKGSNVIVKFSFSNLGIRFFDVSLYKSAVAFPITNVGRWEFIQNSGDFYVKIPDSDELTITIPDFIKDFQSDYSITFCKTIK
ncbi:hypothetical protein EHF33_19730 (plasmid) [Deinococcus psychrotolerans]|uniref:AlgX/AlgJ SGNH hydrolase-like domain-containing protein n=1 Tax=Deinococcus psychrotolerans TaxID=2489213 RepID=A0A3G8YIK7_9DEIO|nr:hypothetical protein [Deinococcus psychrotolerans]AZI45109.1 hypothetical protein EHF33_19730 [Deinococcus psychrotolerans]